MSRREQSEPSAAPPTSADAVSAIDQDRSALRTRRIWCQSFRLKGEPSTFPSRRLDTGNRLWDGLNSSQQIQHTLLRGALQEVARGIHCG